MNDPSPLGPLEDDEDPESPVHHEQDQVQDQDEDGDEKDESASEEDSPKSAYNSLLGIFDEESGEDNGLGSLLTLVEEESAEDLAQDLRSLARQLGVG